MELNEQRFIRHSGTRTRRLAGFAVLAMAVLGATAACTGSSSPTNPGGESTAATSLSPTATSTQAAGTSSATGAATATSTSTATTAAANGSSSNASPHAVSGGTTSCTGSEIKVSLGEGGVAMSHEGFVLIFTNSSSRTCTLDGYPGVAIMNGSTVVLNATRSLNGFIGDGRGTPLTSIPLVTLAPGATASAELEFVVNAGETCYPNGTGTVEVTPPNTTTTTGTRSETVGTHGICADFQIHPVVAGTITNG
jgi:Protein of unknown function (DUF4232)